jgi:leucyl-tRNA synthetase
MADYNFKEIEQKWTSRWVGEKYGKAEDFSDKPKHYQLVEFPYPSGSGLHVGHCMGYGASDAYSRMKRMQGFNVLFPMGWDAFGLPTENYAIKTKQKPQKVTADNVATFEKQMKALGYSFDWDRTVNTTDPEYYRWTQWIFLQFYKHAIVEGQLVEVADDDVTTPRLAFQAEMPVNWCPSCKIILANEEVVSGNCERCGAQAEKRKQKQWMLRITAYADRLIKDLDAVEYLEKIKTQQVNWIGRSEGSEVEFRIQNSEFRIKVFTTRADTLFGCTYVVLSPEHPLIDDLKSHISNVKEVEDYIDDAKKKSDLERTELQKDKTGVELKGIKAINPINGEEVSIWIADYVLASYGTGAVMAVPAHDERDFEFAKKYNIPIKEVIVPHIIDKKNPPIEGKKTVARRVVQAIVRDPKSNKFLCLNWKQFPWTTFIVGGVEEGEDIVDAARREVLEETGYKNLTFVKVLDGQVKSEYFAAHKDENRIAFVSAILFDLENDERANVSATELLKHEIEWLDKSKLTAERMTCSGREIWLDRLDTDVKAFTEYGVLINSGEFDGLTSSEGKKAITQKLKEMGAGDFTINFKLRDWIFSRQHYWGEPIPIIYCRKCWEESRIKNSELSNSGNISIIDGQEHMLVPVPEEQLPVTLPDVENYEPTDSGESPLAAITDWVNTTCPKCGGPAKRETDTMPNWAGSSWYFLAYAMKAKSKELKAKSRDTKNIFAESADELKYWMPVDIYNGGMEHTTLHLLYSRFWHKFLYDLGVVPTPEPYAKRIAHGIILGPDGQKMSKSKGNVINPDDIVKEFGADTLRAYIMFIGPYDQESAWSTAGVQGVYRFLKRVWKNIDLVRDESDDKALLIKLNQTIKGVAEDLEAFRMNTVVSKLMELNNMIEKVGVISKDSYSVFLRLLFPVAPFIASELWEKAELPDSIEKSSWPEIDDKYLTDDTIEIVIQINGKVRDKLSVSPTISDEELKASALASEKVKEIIGDKNILKTIVVPKKLVSIVINN